MADKFSDLQGQHHARQMFEGRMVDPTGAKVICDNLERAATDPSRLNRDFASGVMRIVRRVRKALEDMNP